MTSIPFVRNFQDLSTDRGYQFKFQCDKCGSGYMSPFQTSVLGAAGSLLRAAGGLLGGWLSTAGNSTYEIQRAVGGKEHDEAFHSATEEGRKHFHQCTRCGQWVCPEVCWNEKASLCEGCAPNFQEEFASAQAQAKVDAVRSQLQERARAVDYVANVDMSEGAQVHAPQAATAGKFCEKCGSQRTGGKFCAECGAPQSPPGCKGCGRLLQDQSKFCPDCGTRAS